MDNASWDSAGGHATERAGIVVAARHVARRRQLLTYVNGPGLSRHAALIRPANWCWCMWPAELHPYPYIHLRAGDINGGRFLRACHTVVEAHQLLTYTNARACAGGSKTPRWHAPGHSMQMTPWSSHLHGHQLDFPRNAESYDFPARGPGGMTQGAVARLSRQAGDTSGQDSHHSQ